MKKKIIRHFVVPFDVNYLHKAIICYNSLNNVHKSFIFHAFCFDNLSASILKKKKYKNMKVYYPSDFETREILKSKATKERMYEYYWSIKAFLVKKVIKEQKADMATYIDCDFMFYKSPEIIFKEMGDADVLIQPNNFSYSSVTDFIPVGYYCSCFESFKNTKNGHRVINWWHKKCMEWCFSRFEDNKFADQKYLDDWRIRFKGVREIANVGANVAPWNVQKFDISKEKEEILINGIWPLVYYHFHSLRMNLSNYKVLITGDRNNSYILPKELIETIYEPYVKEMKKTVKDLKKDNEYKLYVESENPEGSFKTKNNSIKRDLKFKTQSIWGKPGNFFYDFLEDIEIKGLKKEICFIGSGDGRYVIPAALNGFKCIAIDVDKPSLTKLTERIKREGIKKSVEIKNINFMDLIPKNPYQVVFITAALHYELNAKYPLKNLIQHLNKYVSNEGLLFHEYIENSNNKREKERYFSSEELSPYYQNGWRVIKNNIEKFEDKKNPRNPNKRILSWGTFYAQRIK